MRRLAMFQQIAHGHPIFVAAYPRAPRTHRTAFADVGLIELVTEPGLLPPDAFAARLGALDLVADREALRAHGVGAIVLHHDLHRKLGGGLPAVVFRP